MPPAGHTHTPALDSESFISGWEPLGKLTRSLRVFTCKMAGTMVLISRAVASREIPVLSVAGGLHQLQTVHKATPEVSRAEGHRSTPPA